MYKELKGYELTNFIKKYFKFWENDIEKVSVITYEQTLEYLINDGVLFIETVNNK